MDDDITPTGSLRQGDLEDAPDVWSRPSRSVELARETPIPRYGPLWKRWIYSDEVFWRYRTDEPELYYNVVRFPFVPGYFLCRVLCCENEESDFDGECHYPVVGPFPTLKAAMTACIVLGPRDDFEG